MVKHSTLQYLLDTSISKSSFLVIEDAFLHHLIRQILLTFFSFLHWQSPFIYIFVLKINSFENNNIHILVFVFWDKKKPLKELVKHSTLQSLLDTSTSKIVFQSSKTCFSIIQNKCSKLFSHFFINGHRRYIFLYYSN